MTRATNQNGAAYHWHANKPASDELIERFRWRKPRRRADAAAAASANGRKAESPAVTGSPISDRKGLKAEESSFYEKAEESE